MFMTIKFFVGMNCVSYKNAKEKIAYNSEKEYHNISLLKSYYCYFKFEFSLI